jgi:hypothetical protein
MRASRDLAAVAKAFAAGGVRALALKGPALAARLGDDPDSRPVADLDFLVARGDARRAGALLEALGFGARPRSNGLIREIHFVRQDPPCCIDLHWQLVPLHIGFPLDFEAMWAERSEVAIHGVPVAVPSDIWQLLLTCLYCVREAPLVEHRYLVDLVRIAALLPDSAWPDVSERAGRLRVRRMVAVTVRAAFAASGRPPPAAFTARFPEDARVREAVSELVARARDPRLAHKRRFVTYLGHFFAHGRYREDWRDRLRPLLFFPLFLVLPEDDDVERAELSGRPPLVERLLRVAEVVTALRRAGREAKLERAFEARLADPESRLAAAADVELHILGDRGLLFAPHAGELHALTTGATWIWCALGEGWTLGELARNFAAAFGTDIDEARTAIPDLLRQWWRAGLLEGAPRPDREAAPAAPAVGAPRPAPPDAASPETDTRPPAAAVARISLLGTAYEVAFADPEAAARTLPLLRPWQMPCGDGPAVPVEVRNEGEEWRIVVAGEAVETAFDLDELAPQVKSAILVDALNRHGFDLLLHAAMLVRPEGAMLLPAAPGSGKTCLSLALARLGFGYVGDETVILAGDPLRATGIPVCATVKQEAFELLRPLYPALADLPVHRRVDGRLCRYLPPPAPAGAHPPPGVAQPVRWLVFPSFREGAGTRLGPLDPVEALTRLLDQCTALGMPLDSARVARLVAWITEVEAFALEFGDLREAAARLVSLVAAVPAR